VDLYCSCVARIQDSRLRIRYGGRQNTYSTATGAAAAGALATFFGGFLTAVFFAATFTGAFYRRFLCAVFFAARLFATAGFSAAFAAWKAAQRFFVASTMARLPAALSFRFGASDVAAGCGCGSDGFLDSAHRFRCASPMRFRAAALSFRRLPFVSSQYFGEIMRIPRRSRAGDLSPVGE
jgi:hypothetical protein